MTDNLKTLLSDAAERQVIHKASRRKALSEALEKNPDILSSLVSDLSHVIENAPSQEPSEISEPHWTSRLHPEWTEEKLEALHPWDLELLMGAPTLSPKKLELIVKTS